MAETEKDTNAMVVIKTGERETIKGSVWCSAIAWIYSRVCSSKG